MAIGEFRIRINNRKVLQRAAAELRRPGREARRPCCARWTRSRRRTRRSVRDDLEREGVRGEAANGCYDLISTRRSTDETLARLARSRASEICAAGPGRAAQHRRRRSAQFGVPDSAFRVDLGVVRGLDYYTGTIYETTLVDAPGARQHLLRRPLRRPGELFHRHKLPGVGISIGLTRLFSQAEGGRAAAAAAAHPGRGPGTTMDAAVPGPLPVDGARAARARASTPRCTWRRRSSATS